MANTPDLEEMLLDFGENYGKLETWNGELEKPWHSESFYENLRLELPALKEAEEKIIVRGYNEGYQEGLKIKLELAPRIPSLKVLAESYGKLLNEMHKRENRYTSDFGDSPRRAWSRTTSLLNLGDEEAAIAFRKFKNAYLEKEDQ